MPFSSHSRPPSAAPHPQPLGSTRHHATPLSLCCRCHARRGTEAAVRRRQHRPPGAGRPHPPLVQRRHLPSVSPRHLAQPPGEGTAALACMATHPPVRRGWSACRQHARCGPGRMARPLCPVGRAVRGRAGDGHAGRTARAPIGLATVPAPTPCHMITAGARGVTVYARQPVRRVSCTWYPPPIPSGMPRGHRHTHFE